MAFSHGKQFRRLVAQARSADQTETRALIERLVRRGEGGAPMLCLETDADRRAAPSVIVAAALADMITGDEAQELSGQLETPQTHTDEEWARIEREDLHLPPRERRFRTWNENDPWVQLCRRAWGDDGIRYVLVNHRLVQIPREPGELSPCSATKDGPALVNINENTSARCDRAAEPRSESGSQALATASETALHAEGAAQQRQQTTAPKTIE
jgi:hypothetical protein